MSKKHNLKTIFFYIFILFILKTNGYGQILDISGNFTISSGNGLLFEYQYKPTGSNTYKQSSLQYTSFSLVKLNPFISWDFKIKQSNSQGFPQPWGNEFTVNSNYLTISKSVGYKFNFDTPAIDEGWRGYRIEDTTSKSFSDIVESKNSFNGTSGKSLEMAWVNQKELMLISPKIADLASDKKISIYAKSYNRNNSFVIGTINDPYDKNTFHPLKTVYLTGGEFDKIEVFLNNYVGNDQYVAIKSDGSNGNILFDDFSYEQSINCYDLKNVVLNNISERNATVSYDSNSSDFYEISLKNLRTGGTEIFKTSNNTFAFNTLEGLTNYEVKVRGNCAQNLYTNWSEVIQFNTPCSIVTSGYFTSFGEEYIIDPC